MVNYNVTTEEVIVLRAIIPHATAPGVKRRLETNFKIKMSQPPINQILRRLVAKGLILPFYIGNHRHYMLIMPFDKLEPQLILAKEAQ